MGASAVPRVEDSVRTDAQFGGDLFGADGEDEVVGVLVNLELDVLVCWVFRPLFRHCDSSITVFINMYEVGHKPSPRFDGRLIGGALWL